MTIVYYTNLNSADIYIYPRKNVDMSLYYYILYIYEDRIEVGKI